MDDIDHLTDQIIGAAIAVHRELGPGLLESAYERALGVELTERGLTYRRQLACPVRYKGVSVGEYRIDLFVEGTVVVEVKSSDRLEPVFIAQVLTYLRAVGCRVGLIFNFNVSCLKNGLRRVIVRDADPSSDAMTQAPPVGVERNSR